MIDLLKNVEAIRKELGIKQETIASQLGIKQSSYSSYFTRGSDITFIRILQISNILSISVVDIISYPAKYVPEVAEQPCGNCLDKDRIIMHPNKYIELLPKEHKC